MASRLLPLLLVLLFCGFMQDQWRSFSPDGKFSIEFPGEPTLKPQTPGTKNALKGKTWSAKPENQVYLAAYFEIPEEVSASRQDIQDILFKKMREGILQVNGVEMKMTSEKSLTVEKMPAREFEASAVREEDNVTASVRGRTVIARDRIYVLCVTAVAGEMDASSADRFFNSFKILKP